MGHAMSARRQRLDEKSEDGGGAEVAVVFPNVRAMTDRLKNTAGGGVSSTTTRTNTHTYTYTYTHTHTLSPTQ